MAAERKGGAPKPAHLKELELRSRPKPLRGAEAEPRLKARLESAEAQHALHLEARTFTAKINEFKAERAAATRDAKISKKKKKVEESSAAAGERRENAVNMIRSKGHTEVSKVMAAVKQRGDEEAAAAVSRRHRADRAAKAAAERREGELARVRDKGAQEVSKVLTVVRQRSDEEVAAAAAAAKAQDEQMTAAAERHAFEIARVQNRARDEVHKVDKATASAKAEASAKAKALAATNAAMQEAAAERRAAKVGAIAAKGAAEAAKVEANGVRPYFQERKTIEGTPQEAPLSPDSVVPSTPQTQGVGTRHRRHAASPPPKPPPPPAIPIDGDGSQGMARGADLMLTLMRGGAPNNEVLLATTVADFVAIAAKYNIPLHPNGSGAAAVSAPVGTAASI